MTEQSVQPTSSRHRLLAHFYLVAAIVLVLDIVTKAIVSRTLPLGGPSVEVLGNTITGGAGNDQLKANASQLFKAKGIVFRTV